MKKLSVKIGDVFNRLTVIDIIKNKHNQSQLVCKCQCGNITKCMPYNLKHNTTKSCGCLKTEKIVKANTKYKIGSKFGKLTITKDLQKRNKHGHRLFELTCDCGNTKIGTVTKARSCGCLYSEVKKPEIIEQDFFNRNKRSAVKKHKAFDLTIEEFRKIIYNDCYYCGRKPNANFRSKTEKLHHGIDRVDNSIGYIKENCVPCCKDCNLAKRTLSKENFLNLIKMIYEHHKLDQKK